MAGYLVAGEVGLVFLRETWLEPLPRGESFAWAEASTQETRTPAKG